MSRFTERQIGQLTAQFARHYAPPLVPGNSVPHEIQQSYNGLYQDIVSVAETHGRTKPHSALWFFDGRPVLILSNRPIPFDNQDLRQWKIDQLELTHSDKASGTPESVKKAHVAGDYAYGAGTGDMIWTVLPAIEDLSEPSSLSKVVMIYPTEEDGKGEDVVEFTRRGGYPRVVLCGDGARIAEGDGLLSVVPKARGAVRARAIANGPVIHTGHLEEVEHPLPIFRAARLITDIEKEGGIGAIDPQHAPWEASTYHVAVPIPLGRMNTTADVVELLLEARAGNQGNLDQARELLHTLATRHGFSLEMLDALPLFDQPQDDPIAIAFFSEMQKQAGKDAIRRNDGGGSDPRHFMNMLLSPDTPPITLLVFGIRGDNWHGDLNERVYIPAIVKWRNARIQFHRRVQTLLEQEKAQNNH